MRLARPSSAPQLRSSTLPQAPAMPVTPLQLLRARARPSSAWAPAVVEASRADETCRVTAAASLSKAASEDRSEPDRSGDRCTCEASESSLVSTQQPLEHSETSQELDLPEEDCDDANEAELQGRVEALRRKDLQERMMKLQQQQKELEEEQQEVQKLLQRTPKRTTGRPQSAASRTRGGGSAAELRIDGKAISGTTSRVTPKSRPSSSSSIPGALRRSASAPGQRQEAKKSLRDLHYESMRRQAAQRLELLKQREIQREPWTHGGSRPSRPWSAIPGYTGYRPHMEEDSMVGCNWSRASLQCIRLFGKPGM